VFSKNPNYHLAILVENKSLRGGDCRSMKPKPTKLSSHEAYFHAVICLRYNPFSFYINLSRLKFLTT